MGFVWGIIAVLAAVFVLVSIFDLVRRHVGPGRTAAWIIIIVLLPFVGSLLYWGLRRPTPEEVERGLDAAADMRHTPPPPSQRV